MAGARDNVSIDVVDTAAISPSTWDEIWRLTDIFYDTDRGYVEASLKQRKLAVLFRTRRERALMNQLATKFYGAAWRPAAGIVARSGRKRLRRDTAPVDEKLARTADVEFFIRANPGHAEGDMLVCLCPLNAVNWLNAGVRALKRTGGSRAVFLSAIDRRDDATH